MSMQIARIGDLCGPPSELDQAAASINVALNDDGQRGLEQAAEIFAKFNAFERVAIALKAVSMGANPRRVADANELASSHVNMDPVDVRPPGSTAPVIMRITYANCGTPLLCSATPVPVFTGQQTVDELMYWTGNNKLLALGLVAAIAYGFWRLVLKKKGG